MKKLFMVVAIAVLFAACEKEVEELNQDELMLKSAKKEKCTTIQSGDLVNSNGVTILTGYDDFGYNYQAHIFNGSYANVYLGRDGYPPYEGDDDSYLEENPDAENHWAWSYRTIEISMKWNDAWLSNKDCDEDGKLDRHFGYPTYIGSGAWEMYSEKMGGKDGYTYKCKIVAVPTDAEKINGIWYAADGSEIGRDIWGQFAITQEVQGGSGVEEHGLLFKSDHPGLGGW